MDDTPSIRPAKYATHFVLLLALTLLSCLMMMAVHELGHVIAASMTGGTVTRVVLHPLSFSRTDVSPNPSPLLVVWAGPIVGVVLPLTLWLLARVFLKSFAWLFQFFAAFCLLVNGIYIGIGWTQKIGDTGDMLRRGSERWQLIVFGVACMVAAVACSRGLECHVKPRLAASDASPRLAGVLFILFSVCVAAMSLLSARG